MLKTFALWGFGDSLAYHLGEGRVLKTFALWGFGDSLAYHLGEGRVLKTKDANS